MIFEASTVQALALAGGVGAITGLIGGFLASADNLIGTLIMGIIGGISLSAVARFAGVPPIYEVAGFSLVWAALGGLVLGFVVGRANT